MKNITISVDDDLYQDASVEAERQHKSLSELVREFLAGLRKREATAPAVDPELEKLFKMSDEKHKSRSGSVGPLNREELYERGISRH